MENDEGQHNDDDEEDKDQKQADANGPRGPQFAHSFVFPIYVLNRIEFIVRMIETSAQYNK